MDVEGGRAGGRQPFRIGFVLIDGFALMSFASAVEPLRAANLLSGKSLYRVEYLAASGAEAVSSSGTVVRSTIGVGDEHQFDHVFVVAGGDPTAFRDKKVFRWLQRLARHGVPLGGISGGPVILALAGLMEGRRFTVHWEHAQALREFSPSLLIERDLYIKDRDRVTCAGGVAPLDMMYALMVEHHGPNIARQVSDWFLHTEIRPSGSPQRAGLVERYGVNSPSLLSAIEVMENHIADPLDLSQIATCAFLGPRQLNRLFSEKIGQSAMSFYRDLRLGKAKSLLAHSSLSIIEIALATGFSDPAHFSRCYRKKFGVAPSKMRCS